MPPTPAGGWPDAIGNHHPAIASCEITPLGGDPDDLHVDHLEDVLDTGVASLKDFRRFCIAAGLAPDPKDQASAAAFLESRDGRSLAVVHLPRSESDVQTVYAALVAFARQTSLRLVDPQLGADVDLVHPGEVPPLWR